MNSIEKLTQIFSQFPGIGPRQARRFVYFLLTRNNGTIHELIENISSLKDDVTICNQCQRFFDSSYQNTNGQKNICKICSDQNRDNSTLMIVQRDADLETIEKNGNFNGVYFVLGGSVPILEKEPEKRIRIKELEKKLREETSSAKSKNLNTETGLKEIILAMNWNPEGENTGDYVKKKIEEWTKNLNKKIKISNLGKGLSMGTELEYIDSDTLKNALKNRN